MMTPLLAAALAFAPRFAPEEAEARAAASSWLAIADKGRYEESWEEASSAFRENMARFGKSKTFWVKALGVSRGTLGAAISRTVNRVAPSEGMPGGPEGRRYLELVYEGRFENADAVTETVTMTLDDDGVWRMFNYVIQRG
jgi:hypothetical protein